MRTDFVYGKAARTPNIDALARDGLRYTRAYPEAMPTVPARNSILSGRRTFPFRGWYDRPGLISQPGWAPLGNFAAALPALLRRAGWWTAFVTDNPFLGFARGYAPLRGSYDRVVRTGGQLGGSKPVSSVPRQGPAPLAAPLDLSGGARARGPLPGQQPPLGGRAQYLRGARVRPRHQPARGGRAQSPLRHGGRQLRAARALDAAAALRRPVRRPRLARPRARDAALHAHGLLAVARDPRPRAAPPARPLRGRDHADRPLAGDAARQAARPAPRGRHGDRARVRPRHPARRARLDRQDLGGALPGAHARAADRGRPAPRPPRALERLVCLDPRRGAHDPVDGRAAGAGAHGRRGPVAAAARAPAAAAALRLRRLLERVLHPLRPLGPVGQQPPRRLPPARPAARPGRVRQRGREQPRAGGRAVREGARPRRRAAALLRLSASPARPPRPRSRAAGRRCARPGGRAAPRVPRGARWPRWSARRGRA